MRRRSAARPRFVFVFGMSQSLHVVLRIAILSCFVHFRIASFVFSGLKAHVAPRCHQPRVGTILQSKLASGYTSGRSPQWSISTESLIALLAATRWQEVRQ